MLTKIYLIRHGEVQNPKGIFYGRMTGIPLSTNGKNTMKNSTHILKGKKISVLYSSPLLRCKQSAQVIKTEIGVKEIKVSSLITEVSSFLEGLPFEFGRSIRFDHYFSRMRKDDNETIEDVLGRMKKFILDCGLEHPNSNIAAVSHGDPIMILQAHILGMPLELDSIRSGKINYIKYGEIKIVTLNKSRIESIEDMHLL